LDAERRETVVKRQSLAALVVLAIGVSAAQAQMPTYRLGRAPERSELGGTELAVSPKGTELPPGSGSARQGAAIYAAKCQMCHGREGAGGPYNQLVGGGRTPQLPFPTALWDFINRAMPRRLPDIGLRGASLTPDEVYSLTAYLLFKNDIIKEDDVLDSRSLPRIRMPELSEQLERVIAPPR
jgi:cytochrome c